MSSVKMEGLEGKPEPRRINRTLTQKYDMGALRAVQKLEEDFGEKLATVYGCEQDDLPFELDLLSLYNIDGEERQAILADVLKEAPSDVSGIISEILAEITKLQEGSQKLK